MPAHVAKQASSQGVAVIERAILLQQLVAGADQPLTLRELARRADLAPSTVSRLTRTLEGLTMLERDPQGRFTPGPGVDTLSANTSDARTTGATLDIVLKRVVDRFGESATASVDTGSEVLYAGCRTTDHGVNVPDFGGMTSPFHLIASGIILMTAWDTSRLDAYLAEELEQATPLSVTSPRLLRERIDAARETGIAWSIGESIEDITALAVPAMDASGQLVASIGLYGPSFRMARKDDRLPTDLLDLVRSTSTALNI